MATESGKLKETQSTAQALLEHMSKLPIVAKIVSRLEHELPGNLYYHNAAHTRDVMGDAILFGIYDGLPLVELKLLAIAAAYHDAGFLERRDNNEEIGATMAKQAMTDSGEFSAEQIELVAQMILDTKLVSGELGLSQVSHSKLSGYLLDADLSNFGRDDFFAKAELSRLELKIDQDAFFEKSKDLFRGHSWCTKAGLELRQSTKLENLAKLYLLLSDGSKFDPSARIEMRHLKFLASLPLLFNCSLETKQVIEIALAQLLEVIGAEAATVFLFNEKTEQISFWVLHGGDKAGLEGKTLPSGTGLVGWVIEKQESVLVDDVANDGRFYTAISKQTSFKSQNMICAPLTVAGSRRIGAVQVLNSEGREKFSTQDLTLLELFCRELALAVDNAQLYEALLERSRSLEILDRRKSDMLSILSHEFRTPVNIIQTSSEMISSGMLKDTQAIDRIGKTLRNGIDRLTRVVAQISQLATISSPNLCLERGKISISDLFERAKEYFADALNSRKLTFSVEADPQIKEVAGDEILITLVLHNLISNAIRFTPDGGTIRATTRLLPGQIEFAISDTGIGIAPEQLPLIWEKFYEVRNVLEHSSGKFEFRSAGLGLGLSTVKAIIVAHGGSVEVESRPGEGSTFRFKLPNVGSAS